ncbi:3-oxoacid CoA-transferase subunit B [Salipaludibacillus aurantiacus]|uniref:3-oxoacid CoA-transferase n=1 Tax=Salipaludibacillus aurantiacus TaxID=1601833 RepID=A0A1H9UQ25_9BACI|nr:3-oxoacid CoA-transferase subunit B [Salipaludibacillus aurantiacus]SES11492.1 3-oxoacid CoA-transferase [Salipaludibacillus aurantiacus]
MNHKQRIASRVARELKDGDIVNAGIGIPTLVPDFIPDGVEVFLHSENGILGVGPFPEEGNIDENIINAGKKPVTVKEGASYFDSASSFGMIRGGHIDVAILGALEIDETGRIANWAVPGKPVLGVGGAMDLLEGAKKIFITITHTTKDGKPKIVKENHYPVTSERKADLIITDLAVFKVTSKGLVLTEIFAHSSLQEVEQKTEGAFTIDPSLKQTN